MNLLKQVDTFAPRPVASGQRVIMRVLPGRWMVVPAALAGGAGMLFFGGAARANEPRNTTEPRVMQEPGEVTDVIDAFDDGDPFDINISLGFDYASKSARILRETSIPAPGLTTGGFKTHMLNVAAYGETTARLSPRVDVGLYRDIALHLTLPIILTNARQLSTIDGKPTAGSALMGMPGEKLFSVPFSSPTRNGIEHIAAGIDFGLSNQARTPTSPTWVLGFEGRFSVGTPMHACTSSPSAVRDAMGNIVSPGQLQVACADPSDINRSGRHGTATDSGFEGNFDIGDGTGRSPGVSRGTLGLDVHTVISKRIKYIEPYGGFMALFEFQQMSSDYGVTDLKETLINHPPIQGTVMLGMQVIPWENREKFARLAFDMRLTGTYHSEGRDYAELFDALGSSAAMSLRQPQWASYKAGTCNANTGCSVIDPSSQATFTTGLTDVAAYASYRAAGSVSWQVGEYVKFQFGMGFRHDQGHVISNDAACNPGGIQDPYDLSRSGRCVAGTVTTGVPNPNFRHTINEVGRRYWVDGSNTLDLFANGVVMF